MAKKLKFEEKNRLGIFLIGLISLASLIVGIVSLNKEVPAIEQNEEEEIHLLGPNPYFLEKGSVYEDPGLNTENYTAFFKPELDSSIEGTYIQTYNVSGTIINRTLIVLSFEEEEEEEEPTIQEITESFSRVILGEGVEEAKNYTANSTLTHPLVILNNYGGMSNWTSMLPSLWTPTEINEVEIVLWLQSPYMETIEVGKFSDPQTNETWFVERMIWKQNVSIFEAKTGALINSSLICGEEPVAFENATVYQTTEYIIGQKIDWIQIEEFLEENNLIL
jgi:hypothetical protein